MMNLLFALMIGSFVASAIMAVVYILARHNEDNNDTRKKVQKHNKL